MSLTIKTASLFSRSCIGRSQRRLTHKVQFSTVSDQSGCWCDTRTVYRHVKLLTIGPRREVYGWWINERSSKRVFPLLNSFPNVQDLRVPNWNVEPFLPGILFSVHRKTSAFSSGIPPIHGTRNMDPGCRIAPSRWLEILSIVRIRRIRHFLYKMSYF